MSHRRAAMSRLRQTIAMPIREVCIDVGARIRFGLHLTLSFEPYLIWTEIGIPSLVIPSRATQAIFALVHGSILSYRS
jgi:hypothetical protein